MLKLTCWTWNLNVFNCLIINTGHGEVTAARADDELCIDRLHLFTLLFLNYTSSDVKINDALLRKIEIQFFFFFCCGDLDNLSTGANSSYSIRIPRDVFICDRWTFDSPYILIDESIGTTASKKLIILSTYSLGGIRLYICARVLQQQLRGKL